MQKFHLCLCERDVVIDDPEGHLFPDLDAAVTDAIRQIRGMVSIEIAEKGETDLARSIEIVGQNGTARRIAFSDAVSFSA
ncbi:DUF6894 family protein [Sphingomonas sp. PB4P5]|uniref:DUF6894 family protein n=1 Tax=Parasphingomonas puruogangriensis TaxID=3096155 RepID=UPI003FA75D46